MAIDWKALSEAKRQPSSRWEELAKSKGWEKPEEIVQPEMPVEPDRGVFNAAFDAVKGGAIKTFGPEGAEFDEQGRLIKAPSISMDEGGDDILGRLNWIPEAINTSVNVMSSSFYEYGQALVDLKDSTREENRSVSGVIGNVVNTVVKSAHLGFSPISAAFGVLEEIPILGKPVQVFNEFMGVAGDFMSGGMELAVDESIFLSDEAKKNLKQPLSDLTGLATQIFLIHKAGKMSNRAFGDNMAGLREIKSKVENKIDSKASEYLAKERAKVITPEIAKKIADDAIRETKFEMTQKKAKVNEVIPKKHRDSTVKIDELISEIETKVSGKNVSRSFIDRQLDESDYLPNRVKKAYDDALAEFGKEKIVKQEFIDKLREKSEPWRYQEEAKPAQVEAVAQKAAEPAEVKPEERADAAVVKAAGDSVAEGKRFEGIRLESLDGDIMISPKAAERLVERAVERSILRKSEDVSLQETTKISTKNIEKNVADGMRKNPKESYDVAMGRKDAPKGTTPEATWKMWSDHATMTGNRKMVAELASSKVAMEGTLMGQRIKTFDVGDKTNAVKIIRKVREMKEKASEKRYGKEAEKKIRDREGKKFDEAIKKESMRKKDWQSFVDSIVC